MEWVYATYRIESDMPLRKAAEIVAMEESTGTWTEVRTTQRNLEGLTARVEDIDESSGTATIAYPLALFEIPNIPQLLSVVSGNLFGLQQIRRIRLLNLEVPRSFVNAYPGPYFGLQGIRRIVGSEKRPHIGTIVKPKVGLTPDETARVAYEAATGGVDLIKDDETLTDQAFCPLSERVPAVMDALDRVKEETGRKVLYAVNVTTGAEDIAVRAETAREAGANMLMLDVLTAGFTALLELRRSAGLPIHVHRTMHGAITRIPDHGISMMIISVLVRLCGGDQLHVGAITGKMETRIEEVLEIDRFLRSDWFGLMDVFPVASGGLHPGCVWDEMDARGHDIVIQAGGGIHGHPSGTRAGAMAMRMAVDAALHGISPQDCVLRDDALGEALRKWGVGPMEEYYG